MQRTKKIQLAEESITSEEKYLLSLQNLLELADQEEEKQSTSGQIEESKKKLEEHRKTLEQMLSNQDTASLIDEVQSREFNGHSFKATSYDIDVYCQYCSKLLLNRQGLACPSKLPFSSSFLFFF